MLSRAICWLTVGLLLVGTFLGGCRGVMFERGDIGFFPPGTTYQYGYAYGAFWYMETSDSGSTYSRQEKDVWVRVEDRKGARLLNDKMHFRCCQIIGKCSWSRFDTLDVELLEEGDANVGDPYSAALAKTGPRTIARLKYRYDATNGQFERVQ